eukprot:3956454-Pyramimonas_sp.AAC.1
MQASALCQFRRLWRRLLFHGQLAGRWYPSGSAAASDAIPSQRIAIFSARRTTQRSCWDTEWIENRRMLVQQLPPYFL